MKNKLALTLLAALLAAPVSADQKPVRHYEVDTWGFDPDIYEFTPTGHNHMPCLILVSGGDTAAGMHCFPKDRVPEVKVKKVKTKEIKHEG